MSSEVVNRPEGYCGRCRRVILLDDGGRCRSCKGRRLAPIDGGWAEKSKQAVAARYGLERARENAETAVEAEEVVS